MRTPLKRRLAVAIAIPISAGIAFAAVSLAQEPADVSEPDIVKREARERASDIPEVLRNAYGVFRRASTANDSLGGDDRGWFQPPDKSVENAGKSFAGANPTLARRVAQIADGRTYLVVGRDQACLLALRNEGQGFQCGTIEQAAESGLFQGSAASSGIDGRRLEGAVPDTIATVRVHPAAGPVVGVPIKQNGFAVEFPGRLKAFELLRADGSVHERIEVNEPPE